MTAHRSRYPRTRRGHRLWLMGGALVCAAAVGAGLLGYHSPTAASIPERVEPAVTAVLVGPFASVEIAGDAFDTAVSAAVRGGHEFVVGPLTSAGAAAHRRLVGEGEYDVARHRDLEEKRAAVGTHFEQLIGAAPGGTAMDGLHALDQHLLGLPHGSVDVLIIGDVLRVSPDVDLRSPIQRGDVDASLAAVQASGLLPRCAAWRVHVVGGAAMSRDSRLDVQAREFWRRLVERCGGQLTLWDATQLPRFPSAIAVPAVKVPVPCAVLFTLGSDVLFGTAEWAVQPAAFPVLEDLLSSLTMTHPDAKVDIHGHTDADGGPGFDNDALGRLRADSVRQWLLDRGVAADRLTAQGHGSDEPVAGNETAAGRELNRRVEIRLRLASTECPN